MFCDFIVTVWDKQLVSRQIKVYYTMQELHVQKIHFKFKFFDS